ncbi:hypothetical protein BV898_02721 [Hypsibius exemplaris]|uniref:GB1/RHD3-type G domain-containing protein n=1 Tax=Hypsibius exemplaris TaxID=2072580 RepID=A0A1W0X6V1_HYPEX|nr:hypothetical protein BV898_02721 [Hypsibius exemplaris]
MIPYLPLVLLCNLMIHELIGQSRSASPTAASPGVTECVTTRAYPADCCWCSSVAQSDRTLEIAQIHASTGIVRLINIEELKEVLTSPEIGDAKIVIFSLVGETRAGKSTLLNIIYRYLACHQQKRWRKDLALHEWLYEREDWNGMRHIFSTSSMSRAHTKNIWITKEPFMLTMGKLRNRVAVFLIDTQGLFDTEGNSTVDSQLFYLSSLLSSTLVVNKMRRLDGQLTKTVAAYTLQMTSAVKSTSLVSAGKSKFLQDLVFLIRDAQFLDPYGWESGKALLQAAFPRSDDDLLREMEAAFQHISCFLMPNIAFNTTNLRILPSTLTADFGPQVQKFLDKLFSPGTIRPKTFYGRPITAREYAQHIQMVETFMKNGSFPSVQDVHEALMGQAVQRTSEEACNKYRYNMDGSVLNSVDVLSENTFDRYHVAFVDQAKGYIRSSYLLGASQQYITDALEIVNLCIEKARKDYLVKLLLQKDAAELKRKNAVAEEANRKAEAELDKARVTINQQSTVMAQEDSWADAITRPVKLVVLGVIGFGSLCVLYAAVTCLGKRCIKT